MSSSVDFIYGVVAIPLSNLGSYCTSGWKGPTNISCSSADGAWGPPHSCPNQLFSGGYCSGFCANYKCSSIVPEDTTLSCSMSNSVYSIMLANKEIPLVNSLDPRQMGPTLAATTAIQNYAAPTVETTTGVVNITPPPTCYHVGTVPTNIGYLVLAYPLTWFVNWTDLDQFAPLQGTLNPGGSAAFLNQGNGNPSPGSNGIFTVQLANGTTFNVPSLETQWGSILTQFCSGSTTSCLPGINTGWGFCSNIFGARSGNAPNYCLNVYNSLPSTVEPMATWQAAADAAGIQYCSAFNTGTGSTPSGPPECYCITPTAVNTFLELNKELTKAQINALNPYQPTPSGWSDMGNIGCWWFPCQNPNNTLVPRDVKEGQAECPAVCDNVVQIFGAKGSEINIDKLTIEQNIQCCNPQSESYSGSCSAGGSTPTPPPSPRAKTFWQKYWGWIVFGGLILLLLLALVLWMIFKK